MATMPEAAVTEPTTLNQYEAWLRDVGLDAPWSRPGPLIASKENRVQPFIWRWADIAPRLERSPDFMAPGAYTVVEGQKCAMSRGDLVLTPHMTVHGHGNQGDGPVIWVDILDSPVVRYLKILSMEHPTEMPPPDRSLNIHYHWADMEAELERRATEDGDPYDDVIVDYRDPKTGSTDLPSISLLRADAAAGRGDPDAPSHRDGDLPCGQRKRHDDGRRRRVRVVAR
jgi:gentisate 1,2-dioxygenase